MREPSDEAARLRADIEALGSDGSPAAALTAQRAIRRLWDLSPGHTTASFVAKHFAWIGHHTRLAGCRVFIMRSFTVESALPLFKAQALVGGIDVAAELGGFNTYAQEILDPGSRLYEGRFDVVILAVQLRDLAPELWDRFADADAEGPRQAIERVAASFEGWIRTFRSRSDAHLIVHLLECPDAVHGIADAQSADSQVGAVQEINARIRSACRDCRSVYVLDLDRLISRTGSCHWYDDRLWLAARMPFAQQGLLAISREWVRFLHPITGRVCKCLVCDLDNTLWGGVIGEDGVSGIRLGREHPGAAYASLQRAILDLAQRGVILAIASKNNPDEALGAIRAHPGMLLREEHFAALRINWTDKATSIREIARELNIGTDSIAFLDDNPVERAWVAEQLPEVTVIPLPQDPGGFAPALRDAMVFERLGITADDRERGRQYAEQRIRAELQEGAGSLEEFYASLRQRVRVSSLSPASLARVAQLTNKTNQFNLTTRRYSEQQLERLSGSGGALVRSLQVTDRFGDSGLVGVAIAFVKEEDGRRVCELDTFLLSCRVIGRTVETAFLASIAEEARSMGATLLRAWFIPSKKNAPAREFLPDHGFLKVADTDESQTWELDLSVSAVAFPAWITRE